MKSKSKIYAQLMVEVLDGLPADRQGVSEKEAEQKVKAFKSLLYRRGDFRQIGKILQEFSRAWEERKGKIATIVTAVPLSDKAKKDIDESLAKGGYTATENIDENVIGGMALYLGNEYVIDGTIKGKLRKLEEALTKKF